MNREEPPACYGQISEVSVSNNETVLEANEAVIPKLLHALRTRAHSKNNIIPFPEVSRIMSWWRITKKERDTILYILKQKGILKIVAFHGIILEGEGRMK